MPQLIVWSPEQMEEAARGLGEIAQRYGIYLQTCGTNGDFRRYGIHPSGCITLDILGRANGLVFKQLRHKGMRQGCHCIESRDIGAYDSCPNGCLYCYANRTPQKARANFRLHDPASPLLIGNLQPGDQLTCGAQKSFLR